MTITQAELKALLCYDSETGVFTWRVNRPACVAGKVAGSRKGQYWRIGLMNGMHHAHRLAWLYVHGHWPASCLDHINGDPSDNRIANLREATYAENSQNRAKHRNNSSGHTGVVKHRDGWQAQIMAAGKSKYLGRFQTSKEAQVAYLKAKSELHQFNPEPRAL